MPGIAVTLGLVLATIATMIFGELVPKKLGIAIPLPIARRTQGFMRGFTTVMTWPIKAAQRLGQRRRAGARRRAAGGAPLGAVLRRARLAGQPLGERGHPGHRDRPPGAALGGLRPAHRRRDHDARGCRWPASTPPTRSARSSSSPAPPGFSKFPVIKGTSDNVVGSVHVKQAVAVPRSERAHTLVREVMVDATVVPESLRLDPLLSLLRGEGFQMAIVSDEYGGTAGVVTLEDVVEEIVGDIADEHDRYGARLRQRPDGSWIVSGPAASRRGGRRHRAGAARGRGLRHGGRPAGPRARPDPRPRRPGDRARCRS